MAEAVVKTKQVVVSDGIEYEIIGKFFCFLIACGGLLAGNMVSQRSFDYWFEDIVPLGFMAWMGIGLVRSLCQTIVFQQDPPKVSPAVIKQAIQQEQAVMAALPSAKQYTAEEVLDQVSKRIEAQKAEALKKNKAG